MQEAGTYREVDDEMYLSLPEVCRQQGVGLDEVDHILDSGTEAGVTSPQDILLLRNLREERMILEGVTGSALVRYVGDHLLGSTRIVDNFRRSTLVTDAQFGKHYQMINPEPDLVYLVPWCRERGFEQDMVFCPR
jgi:hypothetical protein